MQLSNTLLVTPLYIALLGIIFIPFTLRVGFYRINNKINLGDGDDPEMLRRIRGQANFVETVPLAVVLLLVMELVGAGPIWLHALGATLVLGRLMHYMGLARLGPGIGRPIGMTATLIVYLVSSVWILVRLM